MSLQDVTSFHHLPSHPNIDPVLWCTSWLFFSSLNMSLTSQESRSSKCITASRAMAVRIMSICPRKLIFNVRDCRDTGHRWCPGIACSLSRNQQGHPIHRFREAQHIKQMMPRQAAHLLCSRTCHQTFTAQLKDTMLVTTVDLGKSRPPCDECDACG